MSTIIDVTEHKELREAIQEAVDSAVDILHVPDIRTQVYFPDKVPYHFRYS